MAPHGHLFAMTEHHADESAVDRAAPTLRFPTTKPPPAAPPRLLTEADLDANPWAACGQAAVAALLERPLVDVRHAFPPHRWCNLSQMRAALTTLGVTWTNGPSSNQIATVMPVRGLALIQFEGPWTRPGASVSAALKHTHWLAVGAPLPLMGPGQPVSMVFDINMVDERRNGGWTPDWFWAARVVKALMQNIPKCSGKWHVRATIEMPL